MKALDAGALLAVLQGDSAAKALLRSLRGEEVATTELAVLHLMAESEKGPDRGRNARRAAVDRVRRNLTVLPIDSRAIAEGARRVRGAHPGSDLLRLAEWGALEANGCDQLFTRSRALPPGKWRFKVTRIKAA